MIILRCVQDLSSKIKLNLQSAQIDMTSEIKLTLQVCSKSYITRKTKPTLQVCSKSYDLENKT